MSNGWIKLNRSENTRELQKNAKAFTLLSVIATRAKRTDCISIYGLSVGQAMLGDHKSYGLTRQEYRTAKNKLEKMGLATFQTTNKGTIATILDKTIYDINQEIEQPSSEPSSNYQASNREPSGSTQPTTNKNVKNAIKATTSKDTVVDVEKYPSEIRERFSTEKQFKSFCIDCGGDIELMQAYLDYADQQANIDNPIGFAISLVKEYKQQGPPLSVDQVRKLEAAKTKKSKEFLNKIIWPEFRKHRPDLTEQSSKDDIEAAKNVIEEISNHVIGKSKPENKEDANKIKNAIQNCEFDLHTGQIKIEEKNKWF